MQGIPHIASTPHDGRSSPVPPARRAQHQGHETARPLPHPAAAPRVRPVARRPRAVDPQPPVFIDQSGWRRRALQGVALVVSCVCVGYLLFVGVLVSGLLQPVGTHPPSTNAPEPSGPDTGESADGPGVRARTDAHRPPTGARARTGARADAGSRAGTGTHTEAGSRARTGTHAEAGAHPQPRAHADRDDHHRPPSGRSTPPPAGGPRQ